MARKLPTMIFVGPIKEARSKVQHKRCLAEITEFDAYGNARMLRLLRDSEQLDAEASCFMSIYVPVAYLPDTEVKNAQSDN